MKMKSRKLRYITELRPASDIKQPLVDNRLYNPKPFYKMTDAEIRAFASRQAMAASHSIRMTVDEVERYAAGVYYSILFFNERDRRHADYMLYLEELRQSEKDTTLKAFLPKKIKL